MLSWSLKAQLCYGVEFGSVASWHSLGPTCCPRKPWRSPGVWSPPHLALQSKVKDKNSISSGKLAGGSFKPKKTSQILRMCLQTMGPLLEGSVEAENAFGVRERHK